ncbi:MAG: RIP metalloprotease RseP [Salinibacter sp.]
MELLITLLTSTLWFLLAITILVFVHELGHFLTAKYFGMRVERFSIGFPPTLLGRRYGNTEYALGATPLGGYVKISGMIDESLDTDYTETEPDPWEFRAKPVWQRIVVISAGVVFNVILAILIFAGIKWAEGETYIPAQNIDQVYVQEGTVAHDIGLRTGDRILEVNGKPFERFEQISPPAIVSADSLTVTVRREGATEQLVGPPDIITRLSRAQNSGTGFGLGYYPPLIGQVQADSPADSVKLQAGDRILSIEGDTVRFWQEMVALIQESEGDPLRVRWQRPDSLQVDSLESSASVAQTMEEATVYEASVTPRYDEENDRHLLGILPASETPAGRQLLYNEIGVQTQAFGVLGAVRAGTQEVWQTSRNIVVTLQRVITGRDDFRQSIGGPVMIAKVTSEAADAGLIPFWRLVALLSVTLAIMNFLPIPALDGGQFVFLAYEGITRRPPSVRVRLIAQQAGMILLLGFMAFIIFNDILRL